MNQKFIPVLFDGSPQLLLPKPVREHDYYRLPHDYEKLLRRLTGQPAVAKGPVGAGKVLPPVR